jgi:hypothetical protein
MRSQLEKRINLDMIWCAVILVGAGLCLGSGIGSGTFTNSFVNNAPCLRPHTGGLLDLHNYFPGEMFGLW